MGSEMCIRDRCQRNASGSSATPDGSLASQMRATAGRSAIGGAGSWCRRWAQARTIWRADDDAMRPAVSDLYSIATELRRREIAGSMRKAESARKRLADGRGDSPELHTKKGGAALEGGGTELAVLWCGFDLSRLRRRMLAGDGRPATPCNQTRLWGSPQKGTIGAGWLEEGPTFIRNLRRSTVRRLELVCVWPWFGNRRLSDQRRTVGAQPRLQPCKKNDVLIQAYSTRGG